MFTFATCWFGVVVAGCVIKSFSNESIENHISSNDSNIEAPTQKNDLKEDITNFLIELDVEMIHHYACELMNEYRKRNWINSRVGEKALNCDYKFTIELYEAESRTNASLSPSAFWQGETYRCEMKINIHSSKMNRRNYKAKLLKSYSHEFVHAIQEVNNDFYDWEKDYDSRFCEKEAYWVASKIVEKYHHDFY